MTSRSHRDFGIIHPTLVDRTKCPGAPDPLQLAGDRDLGKQDPGAGGELADASEWGIQVTLDVGGESAER